MAGAKTEVSQALKSRLDSQRMTFSVEEAGRILGVSRATAYAAAAAGTIPTIRLGKRLLVPKAALAKMLDVSAA